MVEHVKELEVQAGTRDMLLEENNKLRDELNSVETESERLRTKYREMTEKLNEYMSREKSDRKSMESQILCTKRESESLVSENSRLEAEVVHLRDELCRIRSSLTSSIDRGVHDRQLLDIQNENTHLRTLLENTIPKSMFTRLERDLTEKLSLATNNNMHMREIQLANSKLVHERQELEESNAKKIETIHRLEECVDTLRDQLALLKAEAVEIIDEKDLEIQKFKSTSEKEMFILQSELETQREVVSQLESKLKIKSIEMERSVSRTDEVVRLREVVAKTVRVLRNEFEAFKDDIMQEKRTLANHVIHQLNTIVSMHESFKNRIERLVRTMVIDCGGEHTSGDVVHAMNCLRDIVHGLRNKNTNLTTQLTHAAHESELLRNKVRDKDKLIDGLIVRMSKQERDRRNENIAMNRLRDSIQAAENSLTNGKLEHEHDLSESVQLRKSLPNG